MGPLRRTIRAVGIVAPDKSRQWNYVARADGYVKQLYVASPGEAVKSGQPLLTIYSPELVAAERELVSLLASRDRGAGNVDRLIEAARGRLEQWNLTPEQIASLEKSRAPSEFLTLFSPFDGVVQDVPVDQGRKVTAGDSLVAVVDLSAVWVWVDFYEEEVSLLAEGRPVQFSGESFPGRIFTGRVSAIDPVLDGATRTVRARIDLPNPGFALRPGMYLNAELNVDLGAGLLVPAGAVMPTGLRYVVFIDHGGGKLEPRYVGLGGQYGDHYQILSGLQAGERVVASANFLIDAEAKIQGALNSFGEPADTAGRAK
jgi:Cu(I)/Ag(I) efflux system membrane fusion protein